MNAAALLVRYWNQVRRNGPPRGSEGIFNDFNVVVFVLQPFNIPDRSFEERIGQVVPRQLYGGGSFGIAVQMDVVIDNMAGTGGFACEDDCFLEFLFRNIG